MKNQCGHEKKCSECTQIEIKELEAQLAILKSKLPNDNSELIARLKEIEGIERGQMNWPIWHAQNPQNALYTQTNQNGVTN